MGLILSIETTTSVCSVGVARDGKLLAIKELNSKNSHAEILNGFIEDVLRESKLQLSDLDAVAVSEGPGSYTGLRIGVSTAKGLCYSLDIPLIAISTLQALAVYAKNTLNETELQKPNLLFCPMIDARRMEAYTALYDAQMVEQRKVDAEVIDEQTYLPLLANKKVVFCGDGCAKFAGLYQNQPNALFLNEVLPSVKGMIGLAETKYKAADFVNLAYFEPFYFKAFVAGIPKVKGLH